MVASKHIQESLDIVQDLATGASEGSIYNICTMGVIVISAADLCWTWDNSREASVRKD